MSRMPGSFRGRERRCRLRPLLPFCAGALLAQANERVAVRQRVRREDPRADHRPRRRRDFVVREDGAAREVLRVTPATSPMAVAILVDNTQAATQQHRRHPPRADSRSSRRSTASARSSIIGVADRPTILRDYTTDQKQLQDGANRVFAMPGSGATLLDADRRNQPGPAEARGRSRRDGDRHDREHRVQHRVTTRKCSTRSPSGGAQMHAVVLTTPAGSALGRSRRAIARTVLDRGPESQRRHAHRRPDQPGLRSEAAGAGRHPQEPASRRLCAAAVVDSTRED